MIENEAVQGLSLRDFFYILFKHKAMILVLFFSIILTILIGVYIWPEKYEARAALLIKLGREYVGTSTIAPSSQQQVITMGVRKEDINSEIEILNNRFIIEKVVKTLGLDFLFPKAVKPDTLIKKIKYKLKSMVSKMKDFMDEILFALNLKKRLSPLEKAVIGIQGGLSAKQISNSDVIEIQLKWFSPDIAKEVVNTLINFYLAHHLEAHKTSGAYEFLRKQVQIIENGLKDSEDRLHVLKKSQGITSYENQSKILLENITNFKTSLKNTETELSETITKINELKKRLALQPEMIQLTKEVNRNPVIDPLKTKLLELELEKKKLDKKYLENSRPIVSITEEIQKVKDRLEEEVKVANVVGSTTTGVNTVYKETQKELLLQEVSLNALSEKKKMLEQHIKSYMDDLERMNKYDIELKRLNRQLQIDEENFQLYRKKLEEARISDVLDKERMVNVKVIESAVASFKPVQPRRLLIIGLGVVLSLIIGIGIAFLSEYLDHSIKSVEDVKKYLNLPLLASIQEMKNLTDLGEYERLKNNITSINSERPIKTIMVTSSIKGEGCSTVASNLAISFAKNKHLKVLLIDGNLRTPTLKESFELENNKGLYDLIIGTVVDEKMLKTTKHPNLAVIPSGESNGNPAEIFGSQELKNLTVKFKEKFNYLIFDSPPVAAYPDGLILAPQMDGVLMVIQADKIRWEVAQKVKEQLEMVHANILGVVLNRRKYVIPNFIYKRLK